MKLAFITGGSGFLGKFLKSKLLDKGYEVVSPSSSEFNLFLPQLESKYSSIKYDFIFHLAAWTQAGDFCLKNPGLQWINNQKINTNMIDFWLSHQKQAKFICIGTSCSYDPSMDLIEDNYLKGMPIESLRTYAFTKRMLYQGVLSLSNQFNLNYLHFIPSTLYGPNYHNDGRQMHFIFDLVRKILDGKNNNIPVQLWGDGYQKRELVHVEDFVNILMDLHDSKNNLSINIGSGTENTIREFAQIICKAVGYDHNMITYDVTKYTGAKSKLLNINKLQKLTNYKQKNLTDGIYELVNWFKCDFK
jgi:GDP-L-fucose synthase